MDYKFNLSQLESVFSNNFSSYIYSVLADQYLKNNDLGRAYTVAKIGQEHHPDDIAGKYILAKVYLLKNKIKKTQKLLEQILDVFPLHLNARKLLIEVSKKQNDSERLDYHILELQKYFPNEASFQAKSSLSSEESVDKESNASDVSVQENKDKIDKKEKTNITVNNNMATFTFVDILISQKHFSNALGVLKILEKNGRDKNRINQKRDEIKQKAGE